MMKAERRENVLTGLIGAFLGSLIGGACIVAIGQLGYVASISASSPNRSTASNASWAAAPSRAMNCWAAL